MIYAFRRGTAILVVEADDHEVALETLFANGYGRIVNGKQELDSEFVSMGTVLVLKPGAPELGVIVAAAR